MAIEEAWPQASGQERVYLTDINNLVERAARKIPKLLDLQVKRAARG